MEKHQIELSFPERSIVEVYGVENLTYDLFSWNGSSVNGLLTVEIPWDGELKIGYTMSDKFGRAGMELRLRQNQMTIRTAAILLAAFIALGASLAMGQKAPPFYYNLDKEITIEGVIRDIRLEPRYESSSPFLIILMEDTKSGRAYSVEVSPAGFFEQDFHKGEKIKIVGSLCNMELVCCDVIAREVQCRGSTWAVRDKQGFPNWRKGSMPGMARKIGKSGC